MSNQNSQPWSSPIIQMIILTFGGKVVGVKATNIVKMPTTSSNKEEDKHG